MSYIDKAASSSAVYNKENELMPNTDLCFDIKTLLQSDRLTKIGGCYKGVLIRDNEYHYTFIETAQTKVKRNAHVFNGDLITVTIKDDGTLKPNFKSLKVTDNFNLESYAIAVFDELREAFGYLVEKN